MRNINIRSGRMRLTIFFTINVDHDNLRHFCFIYIERGVNSDGFLSSVFVGRLQFVSDQAGLNRGPLIQNRFIVILYTLFVRIE